MPLQRLVKPERRQSGGDWYHCNSIDVRPDGKWLLSCQQINLVGLFDPAANRLVWEMKLDLDGPHNPTMLGPDKLVVFDNGLRRGWSRVVEWDMTRQAETWSFGATGDRFFSETRGAVQPLPNGDYLITESDRGRIFELTRDHKVVWDYFAPETQTDAKDGHHMRLTIYRLQRLFAGAVTHPGYDALWTRVFGGAP